MKPQEQSLKTGPGNKSKANRPKKEFSYFKDLFNAFTKDDHDVKAKSSWAPPIKKRGTAVEEVKDKAC